VCKARTLTASRRTNCSELRSTERRLQIRRFDAATGCDDRTQRRPACTRVFTRTSFRKGQFQILSGTGAYARMKGQGTFLIVVDPVSNQLIGTEDGSASQ
jgi:hypothetical protein